MVILNLYGIPFHAVVVFRPEHDFLFKSASSYCGILREIAAETLRGGCNKAKENLRQN